MNPERFFLSQDNDCHWFLVPISRREEWDKWLTTQSDEPGAWFAPNYAQPLDGSPSRLTFAYPQLAP